MSTRHLAALLLGVAVVPLAGCGGPRQAEVSGTVTLKNQPLVSGVVTFFPADGTPVAAFIENGSYTVPAIAYGNCRISVTPLGESPGVAGSPSRPLKPGEVDPTAVAPAQPQKAAGSPIPHKYHSVDTSDLKCTIDQPKVTHPIALD